jgi:DNA-binding CsgD family transcriptional regulator
MAFCLWAMPQTKADCWPIFAKSEFYASFLEIPAYIWIAKPSYFKYLMEPIVKDISSDIYQFTILLIFLMALAFFLYMYWYSVALRKSVVKEEQANRELIVKELALQKTLMENVKLDAENQRSIMERERMEAQQAVERERGLRLQREVELQYKELTSTALLATQHNELLQNIGEMFGKLRFNSEADREKAKEIKDLLRNGTSIENDWETFKIHFDKVHPLFFKNLMNASPALSPHDLRHCAYMRMQLNTKEISRLLNINPTSVQMARVRLKKKLDLGKEDDLYQFLLNV